MKAQPISRTRATPASATLLDEVRQAGFADELIAEVRQRVARRKARRRSATKALAAVATCAAVLAWAIPYWRETATIATPAMRRQTIALADGSGAELNAGTEMRTDFRYGRRVIELERGEAFFDVAKDPAHPFVVKTAAGEVRVLGTQFNVRLDDAQRVVVTLLDGGVEVGGADRAPVRLARGEQYFTGAAVRTLAADELADVVAWRRGQLVLDGLTLGDAVARMAHYHGANLTVAPDIARLRLGGRCELDDLPRFLDILTATRAVRVVKESDLAYRIIAR